MLKGKAAVITGSTSGIGLGIAEKLASKGVNVTLNGFGDADKIEQTRKELASKYNVEVRYDGSDLSKAEQCAALMNGAREAFGSVDVLVNNAGIQFVSPVDEFPVEKWDAIIAINLSASFHTIRHAVPMMRDKGWGRIINIASAHALVASPYKSAYVAAKHGIAGLTKTVALEVAQHNITVNAISPGYVLTDLVKGQIADTARVRGMTEEEVVKNVLLAAQPTKQFVTIDQVAAFAGFLCSDEAASITGGILPIDGAWTAQ